MYIWSSCLLNDHTMIFLTSVRECLLPPTSVRQHQNKFLDVASCHGLNSVLVYLLATVTNTWENQFKVIKWYFGSLLQRFLSKPIHCLSDNHIRSSSSLSVVEEAGEARHFKPHLQTPIPSTQVHLLKFPGQPTGKTNKHSVCEAVENMAKFKQ